MKTILKTLTTLFAGVVGMTISASADGCGSCDNDCGFPMFEMEQCTEACGFSRAIRPMTNPVYFDLPLAISHLHPIFMTQRFPKKIDTTLGKLDLGGSFQLYALAFEYAFTDRFSLIATKDGYLDLHPDKTFSSKDGFADVAAGLKYTFWKDDACQFAMSARVLYEIPLGNDRVFQGNGDGTITPSISAIKLWGPLEVCGTVGAVLPFDGDEETTSFYHSWHVSYEVFCNFFPLVELTHFRVLSAGDGKSQFKQQVGGAVPAVAKFDGGDLINLGSKNCDDKDIVTLAVGMRYRFFSCVDAGVAYEFPLTDDEKGLMRDRWTVDMVYRF